MSLTAMAQSDSGPPTQHGAGSATCENQEQSADVHLQPNRRTLAFDLSGHYDRLERNRMVNGSYVTGTHYW